MKRQTITFNGQRFFERGRHRMVAGSPERRTMDQTAAGVDGVLGVDLGGCGRTLTQDGVLVAVDNEALADLVTRIESYIDGLAYRLIDERGVVYDNVRLVRFDAQPAVSSGRLVCCRYRIEYRQLSVE